MLLTNHLLGTLSYKEIIYTRSHKLIDGLLTTPALEPLTQWTIFIIPIIPPTTPFQQNVDGGERNNGKIRTDRDVEDEQNNIRLLLDNRRGRRCKMNAKGIASLDFVPPLEASSHHSLLIISISITTQRERNTLHSSLHCPIQLMPVISY